MDGWMNECKEMTVYRMEIGLRPMAYDDKNDDVP